jgi:hypothetical protein
MDGEALPSVLRIAIVCGGRILEERLVRRGEDVSVGQSARNTFTIPSDSLPKRLVVFQATAGGWRLCGNPHLKGRIARGGEVLEAPAAAMPLAGNERGKIVAGEVTILFQFVAPPPALPRPRLPVSLRRPISAQLDWMLLAVLAVSLGLHLGGVLYLHNADWPRPLTPETPAEIARPARWTPPVVTAKPRIEDSIPAAAPPAHRGPRHAASAADSAERKMRMAETARQMGVNLGIGSRGPNGKLPDLLAGGAPPADIEKALANVRGVGVATRAPEVPLLASGGNQPGHIARVDELRGGTIASATTTDKGPEHAPAGRVRRAAPVRSTDQISDLHGAGQVIEDGMGAIKSCYERALRKNSGLAGRIELAIDVNMAGKVTNVDAREDTLPDPSVFECIRARVLGWRFPPARGSVATILYPLIFEPLSSR